MVKLEKPRADDPPRPPDMGPRDLDVYIRNDDSIAVPTDLPVDTPAADPFDRPGDVPPSGDDDFLPESTPETLPD